MTVAHSIPKRIAVRPEEQLAEVPESWAEATSLYCFEPNIEGLKRAMVENANYRARANDPHDDIPGLSNGSFSFGRYVAGIPQSAAPGEQVPDTVDRMLYQSSLGGAKRGYAAAFTGEGTKVDSTEHLDVDDWIFAFHSATGRGEFYRIDALPGDNVLTLNRPLHFEPTAQDIAGGVLMAYFDQRALTRHSDPNHLTLGFLFKGEEGPDDLYAARGCKVALQLEAIQQGALVSGRFEGLCATFDHEQLEPVELAGAPQGNDPLVSSVGDETTVKLATVGEQLADIPVLGSLEPKVGITHKYVQGVNGHEGVQGYVGDGWGETGVSFSTYHAKTWRQDFLARVRKHLLLQVGVARQRAVGMYWPSLSYREDPGRGTQTDLTASKLVFRAHERQAETELGRSSFVLLLAN